MPTAFRNLKLPTVTVDGDIDKLAALIRRDKIDPETLTELGVYLAREGKKLEALKDMDEAIREKLMEYYSQRKPEARETVKTSAGMVTYTEESEVDEIPDRDDLVAALSDEQLRASYQPNAAAIKALKVILPAKTFARLMKKKRVPARLAIRDTKGDFETL